MASGMQHDPENHNAAGAGGKSPASINFEDGLLSQLPAMRRYARSLTRNPSDSEDLLHDVVERALANKRQWSGTNMRGWVMTIMTNLFRNGLRHNSRFGHSELGAAETVEAPQEADDPLRRRKLALALDTLQPEQRTTLMLVVIEGFSYSEVAEITGAPIGTVMSRIARARARLAKVMESDNVIAIRRQE